MPKIDVVLIRSDLLDAVTAVQLSKATIRNIKQNLFWAFIYNTIGIPLAAGVFYNILGWKLNPMFAGGAMSLSSVSVVSNALRLKLFKPLRMSEEDEKSTEVVESTCIESNDSNEANSQAASADLSDKNNGSGGNDMGIFKNDEKKFLKVEGMSCGHCKAAVEKALKSVDGVKNAVVDLENKTAEVTLKDDVSNEVLSKAVTDAGYEVTEVK